MRRKGGSELEVVDVGGKRCAGKLCAVVASVENVVGVE